MKNIVVARGLGRRFNLDQLSDAGANLHVFPDAKMRIDIRAIDGQPHIFVKGRPVIKNGMPAIPQLVRSFDTEGNKIYAYLIKPENILAINEVDLYFPNASAKKMKEHLKIISFFKYYGIDTVENYEPFDTCMQKIKTYEALFHNNVSVPPSIILRKEKTEESIKNALNFYIQKNRKVILKSNINALGRGIEIPETPTMLVDQIHTLFDQGHDILVQEKIDIGGTLFHIRVAMSFGEIIAAQKFFTKDGYKTSHTGNSKHVEDVILTPEQIKQCKNACKAIGFHLASLDCLISQENNFYILEVNIIPKIKRKHPEQPERMMNDLIARYLTDK